MHQKKTLIGSSVIAIDLKLPVCRLNKGRNTLKVTILGANHAAVKSHMFGLDYILVRKHAN
jgi:hypothetical protein